MWVSGRSRQRGPALARLPWKSYVCPMDPLSPPDALAGDLQRCVSGRFVVEREIARGGMGAVFLARDLALGRAVAIKVLLPSLASPVLRDRFLREARLSAGLSHPHIVPIHAVEERDGLVYFVMGFVEGETLRERIERQGPLGAADAIRVTQEAAWALAHAHARGIVHRDVKPENLLIERGSGRVLLTDFGIAHGDDLDGATSTGEVLGTPRYLSPEQALGGAVDHRADLYSLGATMFFAVVGRPPFDGPTASALLARHVTEPAPGLGSLRGDLPRQLVESIDGCLRKHPEERPMSAEALARDLAAAREAVPTDVPTLVAIRRAGDELFIELANAVVLVLPIGIAAALPVARAEVNFIFDFNFEIILAALVAIVSTGLATARLADLIAAIRAASRSGFSAAAIQRALAERSRPAGPGERVGASLMRWVGLSALYAACVGAWLLYPDLTGELALYPVMITQIVVARIAARDALAQDVPPAPWWRRLWAGRPGALFVRLTAGTTVTGHVAASTDLTEVVLGDAIETVLQRLPRELRTRFPDLPGQVTALRGHAESLRERLAVLDDAMREAGAAAGRVSSAPGSSLDARLRERADAGLRSLKESHATVAARLATVLSVLEMLRLDLVRLAAGAAAPDDLTADIEAAREIGREVDALLQARGEVAAVTAHGRPGSGQR
jgi:hypothetical protein